MKTDIPMSGSMVKNHISFKTGFGYPAIRRTSFLLTVSEIQTRKREDRMDISPVQVSNSVDDRSGRLDDTQADKPPKT